jgi:prepilin-type N-terminal cleavage/methylation domain-containing protein
MTFYSKKQNRGFTLIELLVVIAIIGILSSVVLASLNSARGKARDAFRKTSMKQVQIALEFYYDKYGDYPPAPNWGNNSCELWYGWSWFDVLQPLVDEKFMSSLPKDPLNVGTPKTFCYGYETLNSDHENLQCAGVQMSRYLYVLEFSAETQVNFPVRGPAPGGVGGNHGYTNCIPGPLK